MYCITCRARDGDRWGGSPGQRTYLLRDQEVTQGRFIDALLTHLRSGDDQHPPRAVGYVHGYNVRHQDAVRSAEELDRATRQVAPASATVLFSWPAEGRTVAYMDDRSEARWAAEHLAGLLLETVRLLQDERCSAQLVLVAHSMGAYLLACAARSAAEGLGFARYLVFAEILMLAPDLDAEALEAGRIGEHIPSFARRVTIYHSRRDGALLASAAKRAGVMGGRLGRHGPAHHDRLPRHVVTVDCTAVVGGHSDYFTCPEVLHDMTAVMRGDDRELIPRREADPRVSDRFWRLQRAAGTA